jgi:hypothetical protein
LGLESDVFIDLAGHSQTADKKIRMNLIVKFAFLSYPAEHHGHDCYLIFGYTGFEPLSRGHQQNPYVLTYQAKTSFYILPNPAFIVGNGLCNYVSPAIHAGNRESVSYDWKLYSLGTPF